MENLLGLSAKEIAFFLPAVIAYFATWLSPLLIPTIVAIRRRPILPRRFLLIGLVAGLSYSILLLAGLLFTIPLAVYSNLLAPSVRASGNWTATWLTDANQFLDAWGWLFTPIMLLVTSALLTRRITKSWVNVVAALKT
jgi:hypothetical protein